MMTSHNLSRASKSPGWGDVIEKDVVENMITRSCEEMTGRRRATDKVKGSLTTGDRRCALLKLGTGNISNGISISMWLWWGILITVICYCVVWLKSWRKVQCFEEHYSKNQRSGIFTITYTQLLSKPKCAAGIYIQIAYLQMQQPTSTTSKI